MKKLLVASLLGAFLLGTVAPSFAHTPVQGDTTKVKATAKKEKMKMANGKAKVNNKKGKGKMKMDKSGM